MPLFAQDVIIGGDVNMSSLQIAIDSTMNVTDNILFITKFKGTTVTYYNFITYNQQNALYPWVDGRERSGKYTSSSTAFQSYLKELKAKSGQKFKITDIVPSSSGLSRFILTDKQGSSYVYNAHGGASYELVSEAFRERVRSKLVGNVFTYYNKQQRKPNTIVSKDDPTYISQCYINLKTREIKEVLPSFSEWKVTSLAIDPTYLGTHNKMNDINNQFCRIVAIIHNDELGDYVCFIGRTDFDVLSNDDYRSNPSRVFILNENRKKIRMDYQGSFNWNGAVPAEVISLADNGNIESIYSIINNFLYDNCTNVNIEQVSKFATIAFEKGFWNCSLMQCLQRIATYYVPKSIPSPDNNYQEGYKYAKMLANMNDSWGIQMEKQWKEKLNLHEPETEPDEQKYQQALKFMNGEGIKKDLSKAIELLDQVGGGTYYSKALFAKGKCLLEMKDYEYALNTLESAARIGVSEAAIEVGKLYYNGSGGAKDLGKAAYWLYFATFRSKGENKDGAKLVEEYGLHESLVTYLQNEVKGQFKEYVKDELEMLKELGVEPVN
jgi:TPR repeat protein